MIFEEAPATKPSVFPEVNRPPERFAAGDWTQRMAWFYGVSTPHWQMNSVATGWIHCDHGLSAASTGPLCKRALDGRRPSIPHAGD